jgi:hypothetical protein
MVLTGFLVFAICVFFFYLANLFIPTAAIKISRPDSMYALKFAIH